MKSEEIGYQKLYVSPRPTIFYEENWTCDLDFDVARSSKVELKPNTKLSSTGDLLPNGEALERPKFDRGTLIQEKHDNVTDPTSTGRPVKIKSQRRTHH